MEVPSQEPKVASEKSKSTMDNSGTSRNNPKYRKVAPVEQKVSADEEAEKIMDQLVSIPLGTLAALSPALREKVRLHMTKKRIDPSAFVAEVKKLEMGNSADLNTDWAPFVDSEGNPGLEFKGELPIDGRIPLPTTRGNVDLPMPTFYVNLDPKNGVPIGGLIVSDPVSQYLESVPAGERKPIVVARDSESLRVVWPVINEEGKRESIMDGGSQIVAMARHVAVALGISWNPDFRIHMQSANNQLDLSEGLAKNVSFKFGEVTAYLQVHILKNPAYEVLLGRPFEVLTRLTSETDSSGEQTVTITDPNTNKRTVVPTYNRGTRPGNKNETKPSGESNSRQDFH